ncbi:MAG: hypothetical protein M3346_03360 [Actinomycetota bacterium]|nr:hypothetical protein [Actinomycetota bacterium]
MIRRELEPSGCPRRKARRWVKVAVAITVLLVLLVGIVYAFVTLGLSTVPNDPIWVGADVDDSCITRL